MPEITAEHEAQMVMLSGLNYDQDEIASEVGVSTNSVSTYLNEFEDEAKASDNPERVFWRVVLAGTFGESFRENAAAFMSSV